MPKSHSHYKDFLDLRGDGRVVLYKRADHENPKWTVRLRIPTVSGFVVKSTKTTDDFEARRFAEDLYYRLEGKARRGELSTGRGISPFWGVQFSPVGGAGDQPVA